MPGNSMGTDELKRRIRSLKKLELRARFGDAVSAPCGVTLLWDVFFDLRDAGVGRAKYSLRRLSAMTREEYRGVVAEFLARVYDRFCQESMAGSIQNHDAGLLGRLGLPPDADDGDIKKRFRELALQLHPDAGGDAAQFIELMDTYRKLITKGK